MADRLCPLFIEGTAGRLFALYLAPAPAARGRGAVLYLPPFAEEMNRARPMAAVTARALAKAGWGVLMPDLTGTGDSAGHFGQARWAQWRSDVTSAADWLGASGFARPLLLGLRLGALLAAEAAAADPERFARLVLWQPVVRGETALTQFLRTRVAAGMAEGEKDRETTRELRARLAAGETLEVAGYALAPELAAAIDGLDLGALAPDLRCPVHWIEVVGEATDPLPPSSSRIIEAWRGAGLAVDCARLTGAPFWKAPEITVSPGLAEALCARFENFGAQAQVPPET